MSALRGYCPFLSKCVPAGGGHLIARDFKELGVSVRCVRGGRLSWRERNLPTGFWGQRDEWDTSRGGRNPGQKDKNAQVVEPAGVFLSATPRTDSDRNPHGWTETPRRPS